MADADRVRAFVEDVLRRDKALTEREVKAAVARAFKTSPRKVGAAVIRDVRKALGIDRPSAIGYAKTLLAKDASMEARKVMEAVSQRFGVRLGPPDVSRLRPRKAKTGRKPAGAVRGSGREPAGAGVSLPVKRSKGNVTVTFQGSGSPADLAVFFLELGRK